MLEYFSMLRNFNQTGDTDTMLSLSQHIIYPFMLLEVNTAESLRTILVKDEELVASFVETVKVCLNPRSLHNKGQLSKQGANHYRIAIEVLQISNLILGAWKDEISQIERSQMLLTIWGLLRT